MAKTTSPYSAAVTGGGFLFNETNAILPLLLDENAVALIKDEVLHNNLLHINSEKSRKRNVAEIKRRFDTMPRSFWYDYMDMDDENKRIALFFVLLKTYKILLDFHANVTMRRWRSATQDISIDDLFMEFNTISAKDEFVDSWSESTKKKVASGYLSILRHCNMLDENDRLIALRPTNVDFYFAIGEPWFLDACLLEPYEIETLKR
ncbi:MAG: DUF1819 family protein [Muribaculaceae bacterium]|nr:DUF1819 family protein [Muribaculaceae bacterium]